jgi:hypothetical protein
MLSVSVIINDAEIVGADLQKSNNGNIKKMTIVLIPQIYNKHAHILCSFALKRLIPLSLTLSVFVIIDGT